MAHHGDDVWGGELDQLSNNSHTIPTVQNLWRGSFFPPARTCPRTSLKGAKHFNKLLNN
jgi:hypothetical protein